MSIRPVWSNPNEGERDQEKKEQICGGEYLFIEIVKNQTVQPISDEPAFISRTGPRLRKQPVFPGGQRTNSSQKRFPGNKTD